MPYSPSVEKWASNETQEFAFGKMEIVYVSPKRVHAMLVISLVIVSSALSMADDLSVRKEVFSKIPHGKEKKWTKSSSLSTHLKSPTNHQNVKNKRFSSNLFATPLRRAGKAVAPQNGRTTTSIKAIGKWMIVLGQRNIQYCFKI